MAPPILKLDDIFLSFGGTPLLAGASLQVEPGDRICLRAGSGNLHSGDKWSFCLTSA